MEPGRPLRSYETPPAPVARGGGRGRASAVLVGIVALVAIAIAKPWAAGPVAVPEPPSALVPAGALAPAAGEPRSSPGVVGDATAGPRGRPTTADGGGIAASRDAASKGGRPGAPMAGSRASPNPVAPGVTSGAAGPADTIFGPLIARLSGRSGTWGIGSGGWGISPVSADPWTGWEPAAAIPVPRRPADRDPPSCSDLDWLRVGIVVAVTVPPGLPPDWTVDVARYDEGGLLVAGFTAAQVSPPGNRGIAYLVRPDGAQWRSGAYRFTVRTASSAVVMDACLIAL